MPPDAYLCDVHPTPAEPTSLFYSTILTNQIVENLSLAKPRRESNSKFVQCSLFKLRSKLLRQRTVVSVLHKMAVINPRFVRKKQGSAGADYIT